MPVTRRQFLRGCSAAVAAMAGARITGLGFNRLTSAASPTDSQEILLTVFLRGGMDGLNLVVPYNEAEYYINRPEIAVSPPGVGSNPAIDLDGQFGLHPAAAPLYDLYQNGDLAMVHAAGLTSDTRSHFDAMAYMELGTPDDKTTTTGWMTRHLLSIGYQAQMPAVAAGASNPTSFLGSTEAVAMASLNDFELSGNYRWEEAQRFVLRRMYNGDTWLHQAGTRTLNAIDIIELANPGNYTPEYGAVYPGGEFGQALQLIAQVAKLDVGLHVANVDLGGWDTHENQGDDGGGYFSSLVQELAQGLVAFYTDLTDYVGRLTVVVISEFGRRVRENNNHGTDHGHGNVMLVLGGNVNGGQVFTNPWPGLSPGSLDAGQDLAITIDYRQVLSEILVRRLGDPNLGIVFPGYTDYTPLGIVNGSDLPVNYIPPGRVDNVQRAASYFNQPAQGEAAFWDANHNGIVDVEDIQVVAERWRLQQFLNP